MLICLLIINFIILLTVLINARKWPAPSPGKEKSAPVVSILIPARNEALHIAEAVRCALQQGPAVKEILVYDDHSDDETRSIVQQMQTSFPRVRLIEPEPLPPGWIGKPFACQQLAEKASGEWMLFLDADTRLHAGAVEAMLNAVKQYRVTFLSCWPAIRCATFWEHVFMPMLNFVVFSLYPAPLQQKYSNPSFGLAHGACLFMHRATYYMVGTHAAVRNETFEDTVLSRLWREKKQKGICLDGQSYVSVRMYSGLKQIADGFTKIIYPAFRNTFSFWLFVGFHSVFMFFPFLLLFYSLSSGISAVLPAMACGMLLAARIIQCRQFKYPLWSAVFHPLAEAGLISISLYSLYRCKRSSGVEWKGRLCNPGEEAL